MMSSKRISSCWEPRLWKIGESLPSDSQSTWLTFTKYYKYHLSLIDLFTNSSTEVNQTFDFKVENLEEADRVESKPFHVQCSFVKFRMQMQITLALKGTVDTVGSKCLRPTVEIRRILLKKILIVIQHDMRWLFFFFTKYVWITWTIQYNLVLLCMVIWVCSKKPQRVFNCNVLFKKNLFIGLN